MGLVHKKKPWKQLKPASCSRDEKGIFSSGLCASFSAMGLSQSKRPFRFCLTGLATKGCPPNAGTGYFHNDHEIDKWIGNNKKENIVYLPSMAPYTCPLHSFSNYGTFTKQNNVKVLLDGTCDKRMPI